MEMENQSVKMPRAEHREWEEKVEAMMGPKVGLN